MAVLSVPGGPVVAVRTPTHLQKLQSPVSVETRTSEVQVLAMVVLAAVAQVASVLTLRRQLRVASVSANPLVAPQRSMAAAVVAESMAARHGPERVAVVVEEQDRKEQTPLWPPAQLPVATVKMGLQVPVAVAVAGMKAEPAARAVLVY